MQTIYTTVQVAKICKVKPRTVSKWFDSGDLRGYRIPGSQDRRIPRECLTRFLKEHGGFDKILAELKAEAEEARMKVRQVEEEKDMEKETGLD